MEGSGLAASSNQRAASTRQQVTSRAAERMEGGREGRRRPSPAAPQAAFRTGWPPFSVIPQPRLPAQWL